MTNWQRKRLKDVVSRWQKGKTPARSRTEYYSEQEGIPWVRVSDLDGGILTETEIMLTEEGAEQIHGWVPEGAVLLSVSGTIGKTAMAGRALKVNQAVQGMVFDEEMVLAKYAYYYFQFFRPWLEKRANTVTINNLTRTQLEETPIIFPCLAEQKKIVKTLQSAEQMKEHQKKALAGAVNILENETKASSRRGMADLAAYAQYAAVTEQLKEVRRRLDEQKTRLEYFYQCLLASAFTGELTKKYRAALQLEEPEEGFFRKHYLAKTVEKTEERHFVEEESWKYFFSDVQRKLMEHLSPFQKELLRICVKSKIPLPAHVIFQKIEDLEGGRFREHSVQDAVISVKLLEGLGFLESTGGEKIFLEGEAILDSHQRPIVIQKYQVPDSD